MNTLLPYLAQAIALLPFLVIPIIGLVLCRKKLAHSHPVASARATGGWVLLILHIALGRGATAFLTIHAVQSGDRLAYTNWLAHLRVASQLLLLASLILLLLAILADRSSSEGAGRVA